MTTPVCLECQRLKKELEIAEIKLNTKDLLIHELRRKLKFIREALEDL